MTYYFSKLFALVKKKFYDIKRSLCADVLLNPHSLIPFRSKGMFFYIRLDLLHFK